MVSSSVSVTAVACLPSQVADVVVVQVDVDEGAQLAFGGEEMLLELGIRDGELREYSVDGGAGDADGLEVRRCRCAAEWGCGSSCLTFLVVRRVAATLRDIDLDGFVFKLLVVLCWCRSAGRSSSLRLCPFRRW